MNQIGDEGAKELAKANWPNLQTLNLCIQLIILEFNQISPNAKLTIFKNFRNQHSIEISVYLWLLIKVIHPLIIDIQYHTSSYIVLLSPQHLKNILPISSFTDYPLHTLAWHFNAFMFIQDSPSCPFRFSSLQIAL